MKVWALPPVGGGLGVDKVDKEQIRVEYKTRSCRTSFKLTQEVS